MRLSHFLINEKLLIINKGKKYGQIVFLAGGASSGKGFTIAKFMENDKFKVIDVDEWKRRLLELSKKKDMFPELSKLNLRNPEDVFKLHSFVKEKGIENKTLDLMFTGKSPDTLPNVIFDITMKNTNELDNMIPRLLDIGYKPENIHIVWVLADYSISVKSNRDRSRVVPDDIVLKTHEGAAVTMSNIIKKGYDNINGSITIVINDINLTTYHKDAYGNDIIDSKGRKIIKDFEYIVVKSSNKPLINDDELREKLMSLITKYIPKTKKTGHLFSS